MWLVLSIDLSMLWRTFLNGQSLSGSLPTGWLLLIFSLMSVVRGGEYMTVSRSSAIVNVTYHNHLTDSMTSEVRWLPYCYGIVVHHLIIENCCNLFLHPFPSLTLTDADK